jgi:thiamine biosynthesis protein ThiS
MKPEHATILANGKEEQIQLPCSVAEFVTACGWKATQVVAEYNGHVLSRDEVGGVMLGNGDRLEVIVPVAGG